MRLPLSREQEHVGIGYSEDNVRSSALFVHTLINHVIQKQIVALLTSAANSACAFAAKSQVRPP